MGQQFVIRSSNFTGSTQNFAHLQCNTKSLTASKRILRISKTRPKLLIFAGTAGARFVVKQYVERAVNRQPCLPRGTTRRAPWRCNIIIRNTRNAILARGPLYISIWRFLTKTTIILNLLKMLTIIVQNMHFFDICCISHRHRGILPRHFLEILKHYLTILEAS